MTVFFCILLLSLLLLLMLRFRKTKQVQEKPGQSIGLTSVGNARELGGYPTRDGKVVRKGMLLRTAALTDISREDTDRLRNSYHLGSIIDLRASFELEKEPEPVFPGIRQHHCKILDEERKEEKSASIRDVIASADTDPIKRMTLILESGIMSDQMYVEFLREDQGKEGYRKFFQVLLENPKEEAVLWHCTCGKDRTGVAAMLLLGVLNVDEEIILKDYMLTNSFFRDEIQAMRQKLEGKVPDKYPVEELLVIGRGVYEPYLQNAIDYIKEHYGDIPGYVKAELGLTDRDLAKLQALYTQ